MKNFKVIVSLVALIAVSNAKPSSVLDRRAARAAARTGTTNIAANATQEPVETELVEAEAVETAPTARPMTAAERRAARAEAAKGTTRATTQKTTRVAPTKPLSAREQRAAAAKKQPRATATPVKPLTPAQRRAAAKKEADAEKQVQESRGSYPTTGLTLNMSYAYDDANGLFTEEGIEALVENVRAKYPSLNRVRLIAAAHDDAIEYLKGLRRGDGKTETLGRNEDNELTSMINRVVLETETKSKSAPDYRAKSLKEELARSAELEKQLAATEEGEVWANPLFEQPAQETNPLFEKQQQLKQRMMGERP